MKFGMKLDMGIDEKGFTRLEKLSFDAYNEQDFPISAIKKYTMRTGHYPERILVDQIYRNRTNLAYCKQHEIRTSRPALGRPEKHSPVEKMQAYSDSVDRIEVEKGFSIAKRCYDLGLIQAKPDTTTRSSFALSIIAMNVDYFTSLHFFLFLISMFSRYD